MKTVQMNYIKQLVFMYIYIYIFLTGTLFLILLCIYYFSKTYEKLSNKTKFLVRH